MMWSGQGTFTVPSEDCCWDPGPCLPSGNAWGLCLGAEAPRVCVSHTAGVPIHEDHREAFSNLGLMQHHASSSDPQWTAPTDTPRKRALRSVNSSVSNDGLSDIALSEAGSPTAGAHANGHVTPSGLPLAGEVTPQPPFPLCWSTVIRQGGGVVPL